MHRYIFRRFRDVSSRDMRTSAIITAILVTALGVLASYVYVHTLDQQHDRDYALTQQMELRNTTAYIHNKFVTYRQILLAGASAANIRGADALTDENWRRYYETNRIGQTYPGILGLGYAKRITAEDKQSATDSIRAQVAPDFLLHPESPGQSEHVATVLVEPRSAANISSIGFDQRTSAARQAALDLARDSAGFAITAPLEHVGDTPETAPTANGFLYYPLYTTDPIPATVAERRQALAGYTYIEFNAKLFMQSREEELAESKVTFTLDDISNGTSQRIYSSIGDQPVDRERVAGEIAIGLRTWRLTMYVPQTAGNAGLRSFALFIAGVLSSFLLGSAVYTFLRNRIIRIHNRHEDELQSTKDELLALASHQLRTPASGVRQYLGILQEGYVGALSKEQQVIARKAYRANDRQLEIIDQLLYVAKADAGQLIMQPDDIDLAAILSDVLESMESTAANKNITIKHTSPKKLRVQADERFIRMIIENLISNAIKYSYPDSVVRVSLKSSGGSAKLTITDKGVGIEEVDKEQLFKKFSRIQNPLSTVEGGSGLGLYLAERLAEAHGGTIEVSTQAKKGSSFVLSLPKQSEDSNSVIQLTE